MMLLRMWHVQVIDLYSVYIFMPTLSSCNEKKFLPRERNKRGGLI